MIVRYGTDCSNLSESLSIGYESVHTVPFEGLSSGTTYYFDGPKDLFRFVFETEKFLPGAADLEVTGLYVTDYYTLALERAEDVFYVVGSDVYGPMGHELVPVRGREKAEGFMKDHKGKKLLLFSDITPETIAELK